LKGGIVSRCILLIEVEGEFVRSHRSKIDIIADVLRETGGGARKTQIMYGCNLSFKQLQNYLKFLLDRGLLRRVTERKGVDPRSFKTTRKGRSLLRAYDRLKVLISD
jgi:predicted transcriptional regulator